MAMQQPQVPSAQCLRRRRAAVRTCLVLASLCSGASAEETGAACDADEPHADEEGLCCFSADDIRLERVGRAPGQLVLSVQNFLCEDALEELNRQAIGSSQLFVDASTSFPGLAVQVDQLPRESIVARIQAGHHVLCLRAALEQLRAAGRWSELDEASFGVLEQGEALRDALREAAGVSTYARLPHVPLPLPPRTHAHITVGRDEERWSPAARSCRRRRGATRIRGRGCAR